MATLVKSKEAKPKKKKTAAYLAKQNKIAYLFAAPYFLLFIVFTVLPVLVALVLSFTYFNMLEWPTFVGIDNYVNLIFNDDLFITSVKNTFVYAVCVGPTGYLLAFLVAWFINEITPKIRAIIILLFYAPAISGNAAFIWTLLFSSDSYGYLNGIFMYLGFIDEPITWLENTSYIMPVVIIVALWGSLGTSFLSFVAGLQGCDRSLYEAAAVDGIKNRWQELWYVTLPSMKPQLMFGAVLTISGALGVGASLAGNPSVEYSAYFITMHMGSFASERYEMGYACAIATIMFLIMILCNRLFRKILNKIGS